MATATVIITGVDRTITIGSATADGGNTGADDASSGGTFTGDNRSVYDIVIESENAISTPIADNDNTGTDDCISSGTYDTTANRTYLIEIDGLDIGSATADSGNTGNDDMTTGGTFSGVAGDVGTWTTEIETVESGSIGAFADGSGGQVVVTSTAHGLSNGENVVISGTVNYNGTYTIASVDTNTYEITITWNGDDGTGGWEKVNTFKWHDGVSWTTGVVIDGTAQTLRNGINVTFGATTGHITADSWTFPILMQDTFKWNVDGGSYNTGNAISPAIAITAFADGGGGTVDVTTNGAHGYSTGEETTISGTTNYNASFTVTYINSTSFTITHSWDGDDATGTATRTKELLNQGVLVSFTGNKVHDLADFWTIEAKMDNIKWRVNDGAWTTGVCITKSAQTLSHGVTVTFTDNDNHDLGDIWTITIEGDITIDRSVTNVNLTHLISPDEYTVDQWTGEEFRYNLRTGATVIMGYLADGSEHIVSLAAELEQTIGTIITNEQSDLDDDLTTQNPGLPDAPDFN